MNKFYALSLLIPLALNLNARQLSPEQALSRLKEIPTRSSVGLSQQNVDQPIMTLEQDGFKSLYIFNKGENGYMIVSADDCAVPLLGYSDNDKFDVENIPSQLKWWLDFYSKEIKYASENQIMTVNSSSSTDKTPISPLLSTLWNQNSPYNNDCPMDNGSRSVTGCVATAMAQTMKYYNWPEKGTGSNSYTWNNQTLSLDFSNITFDWNNMTDTYSSSSTSAQNAAVAKLMYACGVSVNMDYSSSESGASSYNMGTALYNNFGYSDAMTNLIRAFYTTSDWENIVYDQLSQGMPVLYGGQSNEGGHQFVCDGYSSDGYFHFNWGWAGQSDGYYLLSALDPMSQGIGGSTTGFNYDQSILINIQPKNQSNITAVPTIYCYGNFEVNKTSTYLGSQVEFKSSDGFFNFGVKEYKGNFGIKITDSNNNTQYVANQNTETIQVLSGVTYYTITLPSDLENGKYFVTPAFNGVSSGSWTDILAPLSGTQFLTMTVNGDNVTFEDGKGADISVSDFSLASNIYLNTNFKATFSIENTGTSEYYGQLMFALMNEQGQVVDETSSAMAVDVEAGQSKNVEFISEFASEIENSNNQYETVEPGNYVLVIFDMMTNNIIYEYSQEITVNEAPATTELRVTNFGLANGTTVVTDINNVKFTGTVECTEGYYANQVKVAVFAKGASSTSIEGSSDFLFLEEGQSSEFSASASINSAQEGDEYFAAVFDANNNQLTDALYFTIGNSDSRIKNIEDSSFSEPHYYNLNGIEISSYNLTPGIYIVRHNNTTSKVIIK